MFNHLVLDEKTADTFVDATGLQPGDYFWRVRAIDDKGDVSDPSDSYKFILAAQGKEQQMLLQVNEPELQGNVVEVTGRTDPGSALIINGEQVADIQSDGRFRFFTRPMTRGSHTIVQERL
jgi:predicted phage tail protein